MPCLDGVKQHGRKVGPLEETADGLVKRYPGKSKSVVRQLQRAIESLNSRFKQG